MENTPFTMLLAMALDCHSPLHMFNVYKKSICTERFTDDLWHLNSLSMVQRFFGYTRVKRSEYGLPDISYSAERIYVHLLEATNIASSGLRKTGKSGANTIIPTETDGFFVPVLGNRTEIAAILTLNVTRVKDHLKELQDSGLISIVGSASSETYFVSKLRFLDIIVKFNKFLEEDDAFSRNMTRRLVYGRKRDLEVLRARKDKSNMFPTQMLIDMGVIADGDGYKEYLSIEEVCELYSRMSRLSINLKNARASVANAGSDKEEGKKNA